MKRLIKTIIVMLLMMTMVLASGTMALASGEGGLTQVLDKEMDEPVDWARVEVEEAIGRQLIPEYLQNDYGRSITREDFCILAVQLIEVKVGLSIEEYIAVRGLTMAASNTFIDTTNRDILAAKTLGITEGTSPNTFDPLEELTREQAAKFLSATARAVGEDITAETPPFTDADDIAHWAKPYTGYVFDFNVMEGIVEFNVKEGVVENRFNPKGIYQRQQAFITMNRLFNTIYEVSMEPLEDNGTTLPDASAISSIKADLITMAQPKKYLTILHGSALDIEEDASYSLAYEIYHHYGDVRMDTFMYDRKVNEITYFGDQDATNLHYMAYTDFAEYKKGNLLPVELLDVHYLEALEREADAETLIVRYETYDLEDALYVYSIIDGVTEETWFSLEYHVPVKYHKSWMVGSELSEVKLELLLIDEEAEFGYDFFVLPDDVEEGTPEETRYMLMYEVDSVDTEELSILGTTQVFYYTKASFHELVLYFEGVLEGSEGYLRADLYDKMLFSGTLNGTLVEIIVYDYQDNEPGSDMNGVLISY